jgi:hypothetical protein
VLELKEGDSIEIQLVGRVRFKSARDQRRSNCSPG